MSSAERTTKTKRKPRALIVSAVVVIPILILAAVLSQIAEEEPAGMEERSSETVSSNGSRAAERSGQFAVQQGTMGDFDSGRQVPSHSQQADFWYQARTGSDRFFSAREGAQIAVLGPVDSPRVQDVHAALQSSPRDEIDVNEMAPGSWIAVRTSEGQLAAFTIKSHAGISPGTLRLDYLLWESAAQQ